MAIDDQCVSISPYFRVPEERDEEVKGICAEFVARTREEPLCLYYGFSRSGNILHCREGYRGAAGALAHLENVAKQLEAILQVCELTKLEVHGPSEEIDQLKDAMKALPAEFFALQTGFRN